MVQNYKNKTEDRILSLDTLVHPMKKTYSKESMHKKINNKDPILIFIILDGFPL
jgi:hypothetical protein